MLWDDERQQILDYCGSGHIIINAGAGTGKTTLLCFIAKKLIETNIISSPDNLLFCSYTNVATNNIRERCIKDNLIPEQFLSSISTMDSFARKQLKVHHEQELDERQNEFTRIICLFTDLIDQLQCLDTLKYIIVDEVQDIDRYRWELIKCLSKRGVKFIIVGDVRQRIFEKNSIFYYFMTKDTIYNQPIKCFSLTRTM
ncbi:ATP-dependent DNA helicase Rep [uncultured archaeon]|nr:ATP-dependent DNA helicase Rep [uncultured archaeon]